ncbi:MAG TPA: hypothetical protein DCY35_03370 [Prolixibacteraceae bacterium]|nr:hypothetical protein [Prolixibacteraceae bacterium]
MIYWLKNRKIQWNNWQDNHSNKRRSAKTLYKPTRGRHKKTIARQIKFMPDSLNLWIVKSSDLNRNKIQMFCTHADNLI